MSKRTPQVQEAPSIEALTAELNRTRYRKKFAATMRHTLVSLVVIVLAALAASYFFLSAMRIHSNAMSPSFSSGDIVVALKNTDYAPGDVIAYYYNDKLLVKRVIAGEGDTVEVRDNGDVLVNGAKLDESYVQTRAKGQCDVEMPYTVPTGRVFVMGDQREVSLDSRSSAMGCIAEEQIVGRVMLRVWPLDEMAYYPSAAMQSEEE